MIGRREFITLLGGAAAAWPFAARGQAARKRPLVGWLGGLSQHHPVAMRNRDAFVQGLREHGYEDGKNVDIVYRWADGDISRVPRIGNRSRRDGPSSDSERGQYRGDRTEAGNSDCPDR
jgi:putative ABC transport system substrate-binding protein